MHRVAVPPQPRQAIRAENGGPPIRPEGVNAPIPGIPRILLFSLNACVRNLETNS